MTEKERAVELFIEGYNCAQCIFVSFAHRFGIDDDTAKKISAGLGGGVGRMREICGAVSASAMVLGDICAAMEGADQESKGRNYEIVREFAERFTEKHGSVVCREILGLQEKMEPTPMPDARTEEYYKQRPCLGVIFTAASVLEQMLEEANNEE